MLRVRLLGTLEVEVDGRLVDAPASRRAWELLAWLALHPGEHPRDAVAARFWPDVLDASARASLRSAVWALRRALGPDGAAALTATRERMALHCVTDVQEVDRRVAAGALEDAVALHRGPLLDGLGDDWVLDERDRCAARLAELLGTLADAAPTPALAVAHARRRLELDPLDEAAARALMARLAAAGDRAGALAVHARLSERLRTQLGLAPSSETREAAARVRATDGPHAPAPAAPPSERAPLVGRDAELAELLAVRAGAVAVLRGEAGIGKTRLAREVLERAARAGARTATCTALELGGPAPYSLWSELLRDLAASLPPPPAEARWPEDLAPIAPSLALRLGRAPRPAPPPEPPELVRGRLREAAADALEHAAADRPLALALDDVHLADGPSLELLAYVLRALPAVDVLVVLTCRPLPERPELDALLRGHEARGGALAELDLQPLGADAVERLVRGVARLPPDVRAEIVTVADGNPLLAVESARAAARGATGPPPSLQAVVRAALGRLSPGARRAAELTAIAGRDLTLAELGAVTTHDDVLGALDSGLLTGDSALLGFRHALLRDAALAQLPAARRRMLHEDLAGALDGPAAEIARHLRLAGRDDLAAVRLARAGRDALGVGAPGEAAAFLTEAVELRPDDPALTLELAHAIAWDGRRDASRAALTRALALLDHDAHADRAALHARAARWYSGMLCDPPRTAEHTRLALAEMDRLATPDPAMEGSALALGAWAAAITGRLADADALLDRLADLVVDDPDVLYEVAHARAFRALGEDRLEDAVERFLAGADVAGASPDRAYGVWVNLSCIEAALGRFDEALRRIEQGIEAAHGIPALLAHLQGIHGGLLVRLGRTEEAWAAFAAQRRAAERTGNGDLLALADHDAGMAAFAGGEHDRAVVLLERALRGAVPVNRPLARFARAEALARLGDPSGADGEVRAAALEPIGPEDRPASLVARMAHVQGLAARARGDEELARLRLEESAAAWRRHPRPRDGQAFARSLVDLGRPTLAPIDPAGELARVESDRTTLEEPRAHVR